MSGEIPLRELRRKSSIVSDWLIRLKRMGALTVALILASPADADVASARNEHDIHAPEAFEHAGGHELHANVIGLFAGVTNEDRDGAFISNLICVHHKEETCNFSASGWCYW
jgi:hypothetical protein